MLSVSPRVPKHGVCEGTCIRVPGGDPASLNSACVKDHENQPAPHFPKLRLEKGVQIDGRV